MFSEKKVSFNNKKQMRAFEKTNPSNNKVDDFSMDMDENSYNSMDSMDDEDDNDDLSSDEDDDFEFGLDDDEEEELDSLSPEEQLRILMAPVDESEEGEDASDDVSSPSEDDNDHNDDDEFDSSSDDLPIPKKKNLLAEDDDEEMGGRNKSKFQKQQEKLKKEIQKLEEGSIGDKPWMLKGEVDSSVRPMNSLLEEFVDFEHTSKPAPILTEELANSLDELIKQRIRDSSFDDVDRRDERLKQQRQLMMNKREQDEDISSSNNDGEDRKNLSQVYEDEYDARRQALKRANSTPEELKILSNASKDPKVQKAHSEITTLFTKLCRKIDSLSSFKFSPPTYQSSDLQITPLSKGKEKEKYIKK